MTDEQKKPAAEEEQLAAEEVKAEGTCSEAENCEGQAEEAPKAEEAAAEEPEAGHAEEKTSPSTGSGSADEDLNTRYLRLAADFQNFRRRTESERSRIYQDAKESMSLQLLEVVDNFERAMEHASESPDPKFAEGMELILKQLRDVLARNSVSEIEALGKPFDPNYHNAVMTEAAEGAESGTVTKVFQKGYMLNQKVLRPSMVAVAQ